MAISNPAGTVINSATTHDTVYTGRMMCFCPIIAFIIAFHFFNGFAGGN
jgi:hypothetical protein